MKSNLELSKRSCKKSVVNLTGVVGVSNNIQIKSETKEAIEKMDVEKVLSRS